MTPAQDVNEQDNEKLNVLGIPFDSIGMDGLIDRVEEEIIKGVRFKIAFSNPEFLVNARENSRLFKYILDCRYNVADGVGVLWAYRLLNGRKLPERVTGTDFVPRLCDMASKNGYKIFLIGGKAGVALKAKHHLETLFPNLKIVGTEHGYFENSDEVIKKINGSRADILMVCLGNPRQEEWIADHLDRLNVKLVFGNGGALDFWSGEVKRAPGWVRGMNMEWLYRLWQDRSLTRLMRQVKLLRFVGLVMLEKMRVALM